MVARGPAEGAPRRRGSPADESRVFAAQASVNGEKLDTSLADEKLIHPAVRVIASLTRAPAAPRGAAGPGVKALMHSHHVAS